MEVLAKRLSHLDSHVEGALRVVMFYDILMRRRVDLPAFARASAGLAECVAGIRLHGTGQAVRLAPDGKATSVRPLPASTTVPITLDDEEIGAVWLERPDAPGPLDEVLLDRLAIAVAAVVERYGPARLVKAAPLADLGVELATIPDLTRLPAGVRAGIGATEAPARSWRDARTALRFTTARQPVVHYDALGALALLAEIPHEAWRLLDNA
jgi:hypothetical protein